MNFLSHFYFDRESNDPERIIGMVLPDLLKNAHKDWCLRPEKKEYLFANDSKLTNILIGWKRHLYVDRLFHSSAFFNEHTTNIRNLIKPVLENTEIRPSFVAHISLELMLDGMLLADDLVSTDAFYQFLGEADKGSLLQFLHLNGIANPAPFFEFLDEFISSEYLNAYRNTAHIIYALGRICMRIWVTPFSETQKLQLTGVLISYNEKLKADYMAIFDEIEETLNSYS